MSRARAKTKSPAQPVPQLLDLPVLPPSPAVETAPTFAPVASITRPVVRSENLPQHAPAPQAGSSPLRLLVARNILLARSALKLTQDQISEISGVSRATIAQIEGAIADCRLSTLNELARAMRISPLILFIREADVTHVLRFAHKISVDEVMKQLPPTRIRQMQQLKQTGLQRALVRLAQQGADAAREAGFAHPSSLAAAGICNTHIPGPGTAAGAIFGAMFEGQTLTRDAFEYGEGI